MAYAATAVYRVLPGIATGGTGLRIFLIQHGLRDRRTHYYGETLGWVRELRRRGLEFRLLVHKDVDPAIVEEFGAEPVFAFWPGAHVRNDPVSDRLETFLRFGTDFASRCAKIGNDVTAQDVVIVAFSTDRELFGAAQWLYSVPASRRPHMVFNFLVPDFDWSVSADRQTATGEMAYHRFAGRQIASVSDRFHLFASNEKLSHLLAGAFAQPCRVAPMPMTYFSADDVPGAPDDPDWAPAHVGVVGDYRDEKGAALVPDIILKFAQSRPGRRVFVQVKDEAQAAVLRERLDEVAAIDLHTGQLSQRAFIRRLQALDILLMPYSPERYAIRTSGIFAEAVAYGLVTVVPDKSWMSDRLAAGQGCGVAFSEPTAGSIAEALVRASDDFPALKQKASAGRAAWQREQSLPALLDLILEKVKQTP